MPARYADLGPDQGFAPNDDGLTSVQGLFAQAQGTVVAKGEADRAATAANQRPDVRFRGDGTVDVTNINPLIAQRLQEIIAKGQQYDELTNQAIQMALRKKEVLEQHPIVAQLGRTLSAVAANYSAPLSRNQALIRGVGAFGSDFFQDTPESLIQRAAQLRAQQFGVERQTLGEVQEQERLRIAGEREKTAGRREERIEKTQKEELEIAKANLKSNLQNRFTDPFRSGAEQGEDTSGAFVSAASARGDMFTPEEVRSYAVGLKGVAGAAASRFQREFDAKERARREELRQRALDRAAMQSASLGGALGRRVDQKVHNFESLPIIKKAQVQAESVAFVEGLNPNTTNPADDQALIYAFAKAMDPDSVVREGEYATVQKYSQSWAERFGFNAKRIFSNTQFLSPAARQNMKITIRARYLAGRKQYDNVKRSYASQINRITGGNDGDEYLTGFEQAFPAPVGAGRPSLDNFERR